MNKYLKRIWYIFLVPLVIITLLLYVCLFPLIFIIKGKEELYNLGEYLFYYLDNYELE